MNRQHILPQILLRSWPFPRGAGRIIDRLFSKLSFNERIAKVKTTDGFQISVFPNELIGRHIYLTGEFDRSTVEVLLSLSRPGDVLLDIGANIGYVSACFLQNVSCSKVIAIDPQPGIIELLKLNLQAFSSDRYSIFPVGIADIDTAGWMEICDSNRGASKIIQSRNDKSVGIQLWSAGRLFSSLDMKIDLVKIDVEGQEELVIKACETAFNKIRPRAIFFEDHNKSAGPDGSIGILLKRIGYHVFGVKKRLTRLDFVPLSKADDCTHNDYLAIDVHQG